jgi:alpha-beta hydrolase superfamily lysophospholipase
VNASIPSALLPQAEAISFGRGELPRLFGWLHRPGNAPLRRCGVVLCNPFAYDALGPHRSYRLFAETLAEAGFATLRFDYDGTGDSAGDDADGERLATWLADIETAIEVLKARTGVDSIALFGLRLSASFAVLAAQDRRDVAALMLWAPVVSGRHFVRELKLLQTTSAARAAGAVEDDDFKGLEAAGFRHRADTVAALATIDLAKLPVPPASHIALLGRDDVKDDFSLAAQWQAAGANVTVFEPPGFAAMLRDPHVAVVPQAAFAALVDWLAQRLPETLPATVVIHASLGAPQPIVTPAGTQGGTLLETPFWFGPQSGRQSSLFGVLLRPAQPVPATADIAAIFLNSGGNHRIGPSRLTVPLSRHLAGLGCTVLRMDIAGLGDSLRVDGPLPIFQRDSVADVRAAIDALAALPGTPLKRFVVVGLCSGGFLGHHAALQDRRIGSQISINQPRFEWQGAAADGETIETLTQRNIKPLSFYARALFSGTTWKRLFGGELDLRTVLSVSGGKLLLRLKVRLAALMTQLGLKPDASVAGQYRALSQRGVRSTVIVSAQDSAVDELETHLGPRASRLAGDTHFRLVTIEGADHTFTASRARSALLQALAAHIAALPAA